MKRIHGLGLAILALAAGAAAQPRHEDPANPAAPAALLRYESAFAGYRAYDDAGPGNWRAVNERVREAAEATGAPMHHGTTPPAAHAPRPASASDGGKR